MPTPRSPSPQVITLGDGHEMDFLHLKGKLTHEDNEKLRAALNHQLEVHKRRLSDEREQDHLQRLRPAAEASTTRLGSLAGQMTLEQHEQMVKRAVEEAVKAERLRSAATPQQAHDDASTGEPAEGASRGDVNAAGNATKARARGGRYRPGGVADQPCRCRTL